MPRNLPPTQLAPAPAPSPEAGADLWRLLREFYQYKWLILGMVVAAGTASYFWTQRLARAYQADCTIEYDPNPARPLKDMDNTESSGSMYWDSHEFFATQSKILTSRALAERVVAKLGLNHGRGGAKDGDLTEAAESLRGQVEVEQERDTRIFHIRVTDGSPDRAMLLSNAIADAYIDKTMQDRLGSTSSALEWLGEQLNTLKQQLEHSEMSLHEFVEDKASLTMPFDDQQKLVSADIQRFNERWNDVRMRRVELAARLASLEEANATDPLVVNHPAIAANETIQDLRAKYYALMGDRDALAVKYGDQHPQIRALDSQLELMRSDLRHEIDSLIANARAQLSEVEVIEDGVQKALAQANKAGLELNLQEITYRRLQRERDNSARLYGSILERTAETDLTHALQVSFVRIVDRALKPSYSIYPNYRRNLTVGALVGVMLGVALAFLLMQLDRVVRSVEEAEALGVTVLGILPRIEDGTPVRGPGYSKKRQRNAPEIVTNRDLIVHTHPRSSIAECCRTIRTNLTFMSADRPQRAIVVTSANPREGKTTVAISLAISLAQSGNRVLLVDTDLRKPRVHKAFGLSNAKGATSVLVGEHSAKDVVQKTEISGLEVLACGPMPPNPSELLHTGQFRELVAELSRKYDHVLFDSPPLAAVTDAAIIAPQVDGVLLVVHGQKTTRDAMRSALRQLADVGAHITGGVLNDVDLSTRQYGYGSYYYYHSEGYYEANAEERRDAPAAES